MKTKEELNDAALENVTGGNSAPCGAVEEAEQLIQNMNNGTGISVQDLRELGDSLKSTTQNIR